MNRKKYAARRALGCAMLAIALSACGAAATTEAPTQVPTGVYYTQAAATIFVDLTQTALAQPTATDTPAPPTETLAPPVTSTPPAPPTSSQPTISASVGTNCRQGPSTVYDPPVGMLIPGQESTVHGRNADSSWWYIANPGKQGQFCWVWNQTTTVKGDTTTLPVITPPPPPPTATATATPGSAFTATFDNVHDCGGLPTALFKIVNSGGVLHSMNLKIDDLTAAAVLFGPTPSDAPFMGSNTECPGGADTLAAGATGYVGGSFAAGNSGHAARATIRLCTQNGQGGSCTDKTVDFTIP